MLKPGIGTGAASNGQPVQALKCSEFRVARPTLNSSSRRDRMRVLTLRRTISSKRFDGEKNRLVPVCVIVNCPGLRLTRSIQPEVPHDLAGGVSADNVFQRPMPPQML